MDNLLHEVNKENAVGNPLPNNIILKLCLDNIDSDPCQGKFQCSEK